MVYEPALPRQFSRWASLVEPSDIARWPSLKRRGRSRPPKPKQGCRRQAVAVGGSRKRNKLLKRYIHLIGDKLLICIWKNKNVFKPASFSTATLTDGVLVSDGCVKSSRYDDHVWLKLRGNWHDHRPEGSQVFGVTHRSWFQGTRPSHVHVEAESGA